jgi:hypothetical protein
VWSLVIVGLGEMIVLVTYAGCRRPDLHLTSAVRWRSWLSHLSNMSCAQKVSSSSLDRISDCFCTTARF